MVLHRFFSAFCCLAFTFILSSCTLFQNDAVEEDLTAQGEEEYEEEEDSAGGGELSSEAEEPLEDDEPEGPDTVADEDEEMAEDLAQMGGDFSSEEEEETSAQDQTQEDLTESTDEFVSSDSEEEDYDDIADSAIEVPEQMTSAPAKTWVPVKKIPQKPWKQGGRWINAVYIAREGDTVDSLGRKIYGNEQGSADLKKFNPRFKNKEPKVGDKIYYSSPKRPEDREQFLTYYDDNGEKALSFDLPAGENIRPAAAKLLGHPDSWKEIWATNFNIESKGAVQETVTLMYWSGKNLAAENSSAALEEPAPLEPANPASEEPPPLTADQENALPPENQDEDPLSPEPSLQPPEEIQANNEALEDMPPFEEPEDTAQGPSPMMMDNSSAPAGGAVGGGTPSSGSFLQSSKFKGFAVVAVLSIFGFWFIRLIRRRKERSEFDFSQTNIDIDNIEE